VLHVANDDLLMPVAHRRIVAPEALAAGLAAIAKGAAGAADDPIAAALKGKRAAIVFGHYAQQHPDFSVLLAMAQEIGRVTGAAVGVLPEGANAVGAHLVGAKPKQQGLDARGMVASPRRGYLVAGVEAELDMGPEALAAIERSEFSVVMSAYRNATTDRAHVMLPIAPFSETGGTFVNMEGRVQSFNAAVKPAGDARPGWKVLRMLGAMLEVPGFHPDTLQDIRRDIAPDLQAWARAGLDNAAAPMQWEVRAPRARLERIAEFALYTGDPVARRSQPLQRTADGKAARTVRLSPGTAGQLGLAAGDRVRVVQGGEAQLTVALDPALPQDCVRIARGIPETAALTGGEIRLEKVAEAAVA
jgi:NADH-quinone oxidoreductase subunit G